MVTNSKPIILNISLKFSKVDNILTKARGGFFYGAPVQSAPARLQLAFVAGWKQHYISKKLTIPTMTKKVEEGIYSTIYNFQRTTAPRFFQVATK